MAVMTQEQMRKLVDDATIVDGSDEMLLSHIKDIAVAALGDDIQALRDVLEPYAAELEEMARSSDYFAKPHEQNAIEYIVWLRTI